MLVHLGASQLGIDSYLTTATHLLSQDRASVQTVQPALCFYLPAYEEYPVSPDTSAHQSSSTHHAPSPLVFCFQILSNQKSLCVTLPVKVLFNF